MLSPQDARDILANNRGTLSPSLYDKLYNLGNSTNPFADDEPAPPAPAPAPAPVPARDDIPIVGKTNATTQAYFAIIADGTPVFATQSGNEHFDHLKNKIEGTKTSRNGVHYLRYNGTDYGNPTALFEGLNIKTKNATMHIWFCHNGVYKKLRDASHVQSTQVAPTA
jgi:hypothetical protein